MPKPRLNSRVPEETKQEVKDFADQRNLTQSEATRRLLNRGLDYERGILKAQPTFEDAERSSEEPEDDRQDGPSAGGGGGGLLDSLLPSLVAVMLGVTMVMVRFADVQAGLVSLTFAASSVGGWAYLNQNRLAPNIPDWVLEIVAVESLGPDQPTTRVEKIARLDRPAALVHLVGMAYAIVAWTAADIYGVASLVESIGLLATVVVFLLVPFGLLLASLVVWFMATLAAAVVYRVAPDAVETPAEVAADE